MIRHSLLLRISNKLVLACLDKEGSVLEDRVQKTLSALSCLGKIEQLILLKAFEQTLAKRLQSRVLNLESVTEVDTETRNDLEKLVASYRPVQAVSTKINPSLLGGIRVSIDDLVFDTSLKMKISNLKGEG